MPDTAAAPKITISVFRKLFPYLKPYRWRYFWGFFCLIVVDGAQIWILQFTRAAVDIVASGVFQWRRVLYLCLGMVATMAVIATGRFLWRFFILGASRRIETELRGNLFSRLLSLSWDFYQRSKIGDLMARSTYDINAVREAIGWGFVMLIDGTMMALAILVVVFVQDAKTAALALIPLPLITAIIVLFGSVVGKRFLRSHQTYSKMSDTVQETFAGLRVVKSFVKEWWFTKQFAAANDDYRDANMALVRLYGVFFPFITFLSGLTSLIVLLAGGIRVVNGYISAGDLVALFGYLQMLIWPLMGAGFMVNVIQRGAQSLGRIQEVMESEPSIKSPAEGSPSPRRGGAGAAVPAVEIAGLTFAYGSAAPALADINLTVGNGEMLGILGRTGAGKSTLIKLLPRMLDPPPGTVKVAGLDVREWDLAALRRTIGAAPQDSFLFSDTIRHNAAYGVKEEEEVNHEPHEPHQREEERLREAAARSAIDRDLEAFPAGWETLIGERGLTLSGGQKQRVAVARALMTEPDILILDDSFSAVDAETEQRILNGLLGLREERRQNGRPLTVILVSHRVSTLRHADKILVLEDGRVGEYGAPKDLALSGGYFARMAALQRLGASEGAADE